MGERKHIPIIEIAASALADKLPQDMRDANRRLRVPAETILRMFTPDHIELHCWNGADKWWNLDMRLRGAALKAKDCADTSRAAKVVRLDAKWGAFMQATSKGRKPPRERSRWPKRPFRNRSPK